jgi:hypothetical protein
MYSIRMHARLAHCALPALLALAVPQMATARIELSAGRSDTLKPKQYTDAEFVEWIGDAQPLWQIAWAPAFALGHFGPRDDLPHARLDNAVWVGAAGARAYLWRGLYFGFQVATTHGKTDALSSPYEFVSSFGWQGEHWQVFARHISNGDLHEPNHGETMLMAGLAF